MTQKDKELLLKDICGRLPYGVKVQVYDNNRYAPATLTKIDVKKKECVFNFNVPVENCLPYLRPMSSMTEEERNELSHYDNDVQRTDFFYSHHIDCRFMIEKGLAFPATENMYKN